MKGDKEIIASILQGNNHDVLETLYVRTLPKVKKYVMNNGGVLDDVKDVFQDAIISFIKKVKLREFKESYDIDGYLFVIAKNKWINKAKVANRMSYVDQFDNDIADDSDQLNVVIEEEREKAILKLVGSVKEPCASLLKLTIFHELSLKEVAIKMNYSSANIAKIYNYRCKKRLMIIIKENKSFQKFLGKTI